MKNQLSSIILFFVFINLTSGQPGFSNWHDFNSGAAFSNVFFHNDTLIVTGTIYDLEQEQWGILILKMDTLGNIHENYTYLDPSGGQFAFSYPHKASIDENGHILISGILFYQDKYFVIEFSEAGELIFYNEFDLVSDVLTALPFKFLKTLNGRYLFSNKQLDDYKVQLSFSKISEQGNIEWERYYAHPSVNSAYLSDVWQKDDNTFIIASAFGDLDFLEIENSWTKSWIFAVDSLGNMLWEWESEPSAEHYVRGIQQLENGDWVYSTRAFYPAEFNEYYYKPKVVRRDSNFNLLWQYELAHSQLADNETIALLPDSNGDLLGIGNWVVPDNWHPGSEIPSEEAFYGGCLFKLSGLGDSLWIQCDTGIVENNYTTNHELGGMVVLPSGSTVAVGKFTAIDSTGFSRPVGWVVKRDKYGCMDELCVLTGLDELEPKKKATPVFKVYPNPASNYVRFEWAGEKAHLTVKDISGKTVHEVKIDADYQWDIASMPSGVYFYQLETAQHSGLPGRLIIQH